MKQLADSLLLKNFISILHADINDAPKELKFACRPLVAITSEQDLVVGRFTGSIALDRVTEFTGALTGLLTNNVIKIIIDFDDVSLSRSAIGALVNFAAAVQGRNKRLYLYRPSAQIISTLTELRLLPFFSILKTEEDILLTLII